MFGSGGERWLARTEAVLRAAGLRASAGRAAVTEILAREGCLLSAQDILDRLRDQAALNASSATVYRTLETLHAHGLVRRVDAGEGFARYEPADHHHHHVVLEDGTVEPFEDPELERALSGLGDRLGLDVDGHEVVVRARRRW
jgi:Fur family ferric uptake transcriptional regulator